MNRLHLCRNPFQTTAKRVLCVCSAGLLRSPTAAWVLSQDPWNHNTRSAGAHDSALIVVDDILINWADEIVCMESHHAEVLRSLFDVGKTPVVILGIPDNFEYRNKKLIELIKESYEREMGRILRPDSPSGFGEEQRP